MALAHTAAIVWRELLVSAAVAVIVHPVAGGILGPAGLPWQAGDHHTGPTRGGCVVQAAVAHAAAFVGHEVLVRARVAVIVHPVAACIRGRNGDALSLALSLSLAFALTFTLSFALTFSLALALALALTFALSFARAYLLAGAARPGSEEQHGHKGQGWQHPGHGSPLQGEVLVVWQAQRE